MRRAVVIRPSSGAWGGNETTARRWAAMLRASGFVVALRDGAPDSADLVVALHATKSAGAVAEARRRRPDRPVVVGLAGTDLYPRLGRASRRSLALADRIVVLQPEALRALPAEERAKARVIFQSAPRLPRGAGEDGFDVAVVANLRAVKDPLLAARAARLLPGRSRVRVLHAGAALDAALAAQARREAAANPRYRWIGPRTPRAARALAGRCRLLAVTSRHEGGPNCISEAIACGCPVVATRIPGNVGLLGRDHPGLFPAGDARALAALLTRAESDRAFYAALVRAGRRLAPRFRPERERRAWRDLLRELGFSGRGRGQK